MPYHHISGYAWVNIFQTLSAIKSDQRQDIAEVMKPLMMCRHIGGHAWVSIFETLAKISPHQWKDYVLYAHNNGVCQSDDEVLKWEENQKMKEKEEALYRAEIERLKEQLTESQNLKNALATADQNIDYLKKQWATTQNELEQAQQIIIKQTKIIETKPSIPLAAQGYEAIYQRFLNGVLIYRPDGKSDNGRINLPIAALGNPLEGTFDLSQCGDAGKYLSISTGYRKGKKEENEYTVEIWFAPRFLIEKELKTTAGHFEDIYGKWNESAEVGIFWTWGGGDYQEAFPSIMPWITSGLNNRVSSA